MHWAMVLATWMGGAGVGSETKHVPGPLRNFLLAGGDAIATQNTFVEPQAAGPWRTFYVENRGVCEWAYHDDDPAPDPQVHVLDHSRGGEVEWRPLECPLSACLSSIAVYEAIAGARYYLVADCAKPDEVDELLGLDRLELPSLGAIEGVQTRFYGSAGLLALAEHDGQRAMVNIGSCEVGPLRAVDRRLAASPAWQVF
jgi:hypothetical protein